VEDRADHTGTFTHSFQAELLNTDLQLRNARLGTYSTVIAFLSRDTIAFAVHETFELELCKLTLPAADAGPTLQTVSLLKLPSLLQGRYVDDIQMCQPAPLGAHSRRSPHAAFPFRSNPEDDILAFEILFYPYSVRRIIFVARRRTLLALAAEPQAWAGARAWEDWGPRATHWMELDPLNDSLSLAGSRCVLVKYSHLRNHYVLDVRDFNPHRVHALRAASAPTVLSAEACFEDDVVCELPFVSLRKENVGRRVLLDDEWLAEIVVSTRNVIPPCVLSKYHHCLASGTRTRKRSPSFFIALCHPPRRRNRTFSRRMPREGWNLSTKRKKKVCAEFENTATLLSGTLRTLMIPDAVYAQHAVHSLVEGGELSEMAAVPLGCSRAVPVPFRASTSFPECRN
jgi:hypothetical protein